MDVRLVCLGHAKCQLPRLIRMHCSYAVHTFAKLVCSDSIHTQSIYTGRYKPHMQL